MRTITCDRCGKRISKDDGIGHINVWYENLPESRPTSEFHGWDFCPECMEEIDQYIKIPLKFVVPEEGGEIADELDEELDAEPVIESEDEPINEPISEPISEPVEDSKDEPKKDARVGTRPGRGKKPSIDWPKFKACVDAGRDNKWLAVEFGTDVEKIPKWRWMLKDKISKGQIK